MVDKPMDNSVFARRKIRPRRRKFSFAVVFPYAVTLLLLIATVSPGLLAPFPPDATDFLAPFHPPSVRHWFGTDQLGRDVYSRVIYGTSQSLLIGLGATIIAGFGGALLGVGIALAPRGLERLSVRLLDILLAFPDLLIALLVIAVLGRGPLNTCLAVGIAGIAAYARVARAEVLRVSRSGYVEQAVILGEPRLRVIFEHIIPNAVRTLLVLATIGMGSSILSASALSFLGLGVVPPSPEWGALLADGRNVIDTAPWVSLLPATVIATSVISMTLLARRLQLLFLQKENWDD